MIKHHFFGVIPPVVTPINAKGEFDKEAMCEIIDFQLRSGVNGLFFLGSIGEFSQINMIMKKEIIEFVVSYVNKRLPILIGTGTNSISETIELSRFSEKAGVDGVVVINPYYWELSEMELFNFFNTVAKSISIPMMLYNFPQRTGQDLAPELVLKLINHNHNIIGIKDTTESMSHIKHLILKVKGVYPEFSVLCGYDECLLPTLEMGGDGGIIGTINIEPSLFVNLYKSYQSKDYNKSLEHYRNVIYLSQIYSSEFSIMSTIKECLIQKGFRLTPYHLAPFEENDSDSKRIIRDILKSVAAQII